MISSARTLLVPVLLFSLAGCGLKKPLYLPDEQSQEVAAPAPTAPPPAGVPEGQKVRTPLPPAPQSQKKDRERIGPQSSPTQSAPPPVSPPDPDRPATTPPGQ
jgi:predicted small lipoprotein YifL